MLDISLEQIHSAWGRVRENAGCAGVDGVTIESYEHQAQTGLPELLMHAHAGTYRPLPLRKIVVDKRDGSGKHRTLLVPPVRDRILQTAVARLVSRSWEEEFFDASYAYRPDRGVDRAVARMLQLRDRGWNHVLDADITGYFDHISHSRMLKLLQAAGLDEEAEHLLRLWVRAEMWDGHRVIPLRRGIAQGSPVSPLLANFFLQSFDQELEKSGNRLIRYADDFVILCQSPLQAWQAKHQVQELLAASGLELNEEKTRITDFTSGFQFLGVRFDGGQPMIPWKAKNRMGHVLFIARAMPARLLRPYRQVEAGRQLGHALAAAAPEHPHTVIPSTLASSTERSRDMAFIYITQQGAVVRKSGDRFLVELDQQIALDIPYHRLEQILVFGNVQLTTQAIAEALDKGIAVSFFTRHGRFRGALQAPPGRNVLLRINQYQLYEAHERSLAVARGIVQQKILNGLGVLKRYQERNPHEDVSGQQRGVMQDMVGKLPHVKSLEELDGCEGMAAKNYFDALMKFNRSEFVWTGRVKHPATDPLNALLSLAYTLLEQELSALIEAMGLDPAIGMLHELDGSRPSLALDLVEAFRNPVADRFVLTEVNRLVFQSADFELGDGHGGLFLKPAALRRFFEAFEKWMLEGKVSYRRRLREDVENFASFLRNGGEWKPFGFDLLEETI